ncbi:hypothetical protein A6A40_23380 (plasmid) [Azospirillum humicireducens]|uniref:Uncharacterized protein n=1 Tax=Azospirillum humicireducens TaxID=1226968 RepID=A0A2R4VU85_9PROT|nr:hypothetical protein A6A40_23380 [Azospirillum humicireducens]
MGANMQDHPHIPTWPARPLGVIPAKSGSQVYPLGPLGNYWIPAFAGMTVAQGWGRQSSLYVSASGGGRKSSEIIMSYFHDL